MSARAPLAKTRPPTGVLDALHAAAAPALAAKFHACGLSLAALAAAAEAAPDDVAGAGAAGMAGPSGSGAPAMTQRSTALRAVAQLRVLLAADAALASAHTVAGAADALAAAAADSAADGALGEDAVARAAEALQPAVDRLAARQSLLRLTAASTLPRAPRLLQSGDAASPAPRPSLGLAGFDWVSRVGESRLSSLRGVVAYIVVLAPAPFISTYSASDHPH